MRPYVGGRQIFETSQEVHERGELKIKNTVIDKVLLQKSLLVFY